MKHYFSPTFSERNEALFVFRKKDYLWCEAYPETGKLGLRTGSFAVSPFLNEGGVHFMSRNFVNSMGDGLGLW